MSTQTLAEAARVLALATLVDDVQIFDVGEPVTTGIYVERALTAVGDPVKGLVQTTTLANAAEGRVADTFSVKVAAGTGLHAGQVVKVLATRIDQDLVGKALLIDKVSLNGAAVILKGVASDWHVVQQQGKASA